MLKKLFVIVFLFFPLLSFARFEKLVNEIDDFFAPKKGYVVAVEGDTVYTDLSIKDGVTKGLVLNVYREGEKIVHPITGEILGEKRSFVAKIKLSEIFDKYSIGEIINKEKEIKKGDLVLSQTPVRINVKYGKFDRRLQLLLNEDLSKANNFVLTDSGDFNLIFNQDDEGGITYIIQKGGKELTKKYYADINKDFFNVNARLQMSDILSSEIIKEKYRVLSVGDVFGDKYDYIVVASEDEVHIYKFDGKEFKYITKIKGDFDNIVSVDTIDLNGNGIDEIFVSNLTSGGSLKSSIYEYDNKRFKLLKKSIPFIFRTISINGVTKLVCQRISRDGLFLGSIYFYTYNGDYVKGDKIENTDGIGIYGFGYADIDGDKTNEVLYVNDDYNLIVYKDGKEIYKSAEYFNETPHFFVLKQEIKDSSTIMQNKMDVEEVMRYKKYFKGRIFVDKDGKLYLLKNQPVARILPNFKVYTDSTIASYKWQGKMLRKLWESDIFKPVIVDYFVIHKYGKDYVILLRNEGGEFLTSDKSQFFYIEIK